MGENCFSSAIYSCFGADNSHFSMQVFPSFCCSSSLGGLSLSREVKTELPGISNAIGVCLSIIHRFGSKL